MGFITHMLDYFKRDQLTETKIINLLNQGAPVSVLGRDIYNIPEIRTAINFISEKVAVVPFYHVRADTEGNSKTLEGGVNRVLSIRANPYQSPQIFFTNIVTRLLLSNNVYIMPEWDDKGNLKWLYPLPFTKHEFKQAADGRLTITFDASGSRYSFYYDDIIHLQRFPNIRGGATSQATNNYVQIVTAMQSQLVNDSETAGRISALLRINSPLKDAHLKKKLEEFKANFLTAENTTGFGMITSDVDVVNVNTKGSALDAALLANITKQLYNYFGVSHEIINGNATELQYEQFVDNTIRPIVKQIQEEFTYKLFSNVEISKNNKIKAELVDLEISTLSAKTAFYKEMIFGGVINRNEVRRRIGLPKGPEDLDGFMESKNFQALSPGNYVVEGGVSDGQTTGDEGT